jgi:hypothetical protein
MLTRLPTRCKQCREKFSEEDRAQHRRIHPACIPAYADAQEAKAQRKAEKQARMAAKVERAIDRQKREKQKRIPDLIKEAQTVFNRWIRTRDEKEPCISCGAPPPDLSGLHAGRDAGHYRSTGSASHLRFHPDNCHAQCVRCNQWGAGRAVDYRLGLCRRIGVERVEALETINAPHKWDRDELIAIKATYVQKLKELRKEQA